MAHGFYETIADYYDLLFSLSESEKSFYSTFDIDKGTRVLDVGCGTGDLALYLAQRSEQVTGVDLDSKMIHLAKQKAGVFANPVFITADMNAIDALFSNRNFDYVFCMGNTLVHMDSLKELAAFFVKARKVLDSRGRFIFQILNYQRIITHSIQSLPAIENDKVVFRRMYSFIGEKNLNFHVSIQVKATEEVFEADTPLSAITYDDIERLGTETGFNVGKVYGDFGKSLFNSESTLLICELAKS
jgi:glycine/sarcosine N-methyltransferase